MVSIFWNLNKFVVFSPVLNKCETDSSTIHEEYSDFFQISRTPIREISYKVEAVL